MPENPHTAGVYVAAAVVAVAAAAAVGFLCNVECSNVPYRLINYNKNVARKDY